MVQNHVKPCFLYKNGFSYIKLYGSKKKLILVLIKKGITDLKRTNMTSTWNERKNNEKYFHKTFNSLNMGGFYMWQSQQHIYTKVDSNERNGKRKWVMECDQNAYDDMATHVRPFFMDYFRVKLISSTAP